MKLAIAALFAAACFAADERTSWPWATCYGTDGQFKGSQTLKSDVVTSRSGHRAWTVVAAVGSPPGGCGNTSKLFVDGRVVYTAKPNEENGEANSMSPAAWSNDGRWLAVDFATPNYGTDYFPRTILLYDSRTGRVTEPRWLDGIARLAKPECEFDIKRIAGFDARGRVLIEVFDAIDVVDGAPVKPCGFGQGRQFALDPATRRVEAVP